MKYFLLLTVASLGLTHLDAAGSQLNEHDTTSSQNVTVEIMLWIGERAVSVEFPVSPSVADTLLSTPGLQEQFTINSGRNLEELREVLLTAGVSEEIARHVVDERLTRTYERYLGNLAMLIAQIRESGREDLATPLETALREVRQDNGGDANLPNLYRNVMDTINTALSERWVSEGLPLNIANRLAEFIPLLNSSTHVFSADEARELQGLSHEILQSAPPQTRDTILNALTAHIAVAEAAEAGAPVSDNHRNAMRTFHEFASDRFQNLENTAPRSPSAEDLLISIVARF
jgi:hypothetical protein